METKEAINIHSMIPCFVHMEDMQAWIKFAFVQNLEMNVLFGPKHTDK